MADVVNFPEQPKRPPLLAGPFTYHKVIVEGRVIPGLTGFPDGEGKTALVVDGRFSATFSDDDAHSAAWLIANALAVAAGYPHLAAETKEQPFAPIAVQIDGEDQPA